MHTLYQSRRGCEVSEVGVWGRKREEKDMATKLLGILFETLSTLCLSVPRGFRLVSLKALKTAHRTRARLRYKHQDHSWIVFKLNAICQSHEPSFHFFPSLLPSFLISLSSTWCQPLFVSITKRFWGIVQLQRQVGRRSLPCKSSELWQYLIYYNNQKSWIGWKVKEKQIDINHSDERADRSTLAFECKHKSLHITVNTTMYTWMDIAWTVFS